MDDYIFGWHWVGRVPIKVAISVGWFPVYRGLYGKVQIRGTHGIQGWDSDIMARGFSEFDGSIYWIYMAQESIYLFFFIIVDKVTNIPFPLWGGYGAFQT